MLKEQVEDIKIKQSFTSVTCASTTSSWLSDMKPKDFQDLIMDHMFCDLFEIGITTLAMLTKFPTISNVQQKTSHVQDKMGWGVTKLHHGQVQLWTKMNIRADLVSLIPDIQHTFPTYPTFMIVMIVTGFVDKARINHCQKKLGQEDQIC